MPLSESATRSKGTRGLEKVPWCRQRRGKNGTAEVHLDVGSLLVALYCVVEEEHLLGPGSEQKQRSERKHTAVDFGKGLPAIYFA